jgi:hypothetical protein
LPSTRLPLPWFARTSESPSGILERVWLTFSPFALGLARALGFSAPGPRGICRQIPRRSSPVLGLHLSGLPHRASFRPKARSCLLPERNSSRHSATLQHGRAKQPHFALGFGPSVRPTKPCRPKAPPSGFGYPLGGVSRIALGSLFQLPTLLGFSLQGLFPTRGRGIRFPEPLPLVRFLASPLGLAPALQRFSLPGASGSLMRSHYLSRESGALALLSFFASQACLRRT